MDAMAGEDVSDPLQLTSLPPLFLDLVAAGYGDAIPAERCVDDCLILVHAYAQLGIAAEVRAAELVIPGLLPSRTSTMAIRHRGGRTACCTATPSSGYHV
jgi:hypothetical protein